MCIRDRALLLWELVRMLNTDPSMHLSPFSQPVSPWIQSIWAPFLSPDRTPLWSLVAILEFGCWLDVLRMLTGTLRGNVLLGVTLHAIRTFVLFNVLPDGPPGDKGHSLCHVVLCAWAVTEVARYPYYIRPTPLTKALRFAVPVLTFPVGAGFELVSAWLFVDKAGPWASWRHSIASLIVCVNALGGVASYPAMVKKGVDSLGLVFKP
eukprot:TRINITY_DN4378_c0_g1_i1.p1 TRINITY_DN4378_c0_g1~~TRINITY_DN4378_c0_g1_i1.p1  ORF type:complete len:208 (+),score=35.15 TRINITY_DN4378_c0_g1_i1:148-771(+)